MHDLIVIGAGPAGLGAAIHAVHLGLDVLVLENGGIGGRLRYAGEVRNFPGFLAARPDGAALAKKLAEQARRAGVRIERKECGLIDRRGTCLVVQTSGGVQRGRSVIIATGVRPVPLAIPGAAGAKDRIHFYWTDIPGIRGKTVAVIGGGEVAFDQACSLAEHGARVSVLTRGNSPRAFPGLVTTARRKGVRIRCNAPVRSVATASDGRLVLNTPDTPVRSDFVLAATGSVPCLPVMTAAARNRMNQGLFLAGDVSEMNCKQAVVAFGDGVQKAIRVFTMVRNGERC
jgi:thioredoxin reductase (NADPH)